MATEKTLNTERWPTKALAKPKCPGGKRQLVPGVFINKYMFKYKLPDTIEELSELYGYTEFNWTDVSGPAPKKKDILEKIKRIASEKKIPVPEWVPVVEKIENLPSGTPKSELAILYLQLAKYMVKKCYFTYDQVKYGDWIYIYYFSRLFKRYLEIPLDYLPDEYCDDHLAEIEEELADCLMREKNPDTKWYMCYALLEFITSKALNLHGYSKYEDYYLKFKNEVYGYFYITDTSKYELYIHGKEKAKDFYGNIRQEFESERNKVRNYHNKIEEDLKNATRTHFTDKYNYYRKLKEKELGGMTDLETGKKAAELFERGRDICAFATKLSELTTGLEILEASAAMGNKYAKYWLLNYRIANGDQQAKEAGKAAWRDKAEIHYYVDCIDEKTNNLFDAIQGSERAMLDIAKMYSQLPEERKTRDAELFMYQRAAQSGETEAKMALADKYTEFYLDDEACEIYKSMFGLYDDVVNSDIALRAMAGYIRTRTLHRDELPNKYADECFELSVKYLQKSDAVQEADYNAEYKRMLKKAEQKDVDRVLMSIRNTPDANFIEPFHRWKIIEAFECKQAQLWHEREKKGDKSVYFDLGFFYYEKNNEKARYWSIKALKEGDQRAISRVRFYPELFGMEDADYNDLLREAAISGDANARTELRNIQAQYDSYKERAGYILKGTRSDREKLRALESLEKQATSFAFGDAMTINEAYRKDKVSYDTYFYSNYVKNKLFRDM